MPLLMHRTSCNLFELTNLPALHAGPSEKWNIELCPSAGHGQHLSSVVEEMDAELAGKLVLHQVMHAMAMYTSCLLL